MSRAYTRHSIAPAWTRSLAVALVFALGLLSLHRASEAAPPLCIPHDELLKALHQGYSEARKAIAIASNGALVELFASRDGSSWTIAVTHPGGPSCVIMAGEDWFDLTSHEAGQVAQIPE